MAIPFLAISFPAANGRYQTFDKHVTGLPPGTDERETHEPPAA